MRFSALVIPSVLLSASTVTSFSSISTAFVVSQQQKREQRQQKLPLSSNFLLETSKSAKLNMSPLKSSLSNASTATPSDLVAVRAVTSFIELSSDQTKWKAVLQRAVEFNTAMAADLTTAGYDVQTLRLIANPFGEYLDTSSEEKALAGIEFLAGILKDLEVDAGTRIRFSIGCAQTEQEIKLVPAIIKAGGDLANTCYNVQADASGVLDLEAVTKCVEVCAALAKETDGSLNFNWTINFNGPNLCPYFPAGFNPSGGGESFVLGLEYPNLLVSVLENLVPAGETSIVTSPENRTKEWNAAFDAMLSAIECHVGVMAGLAKAASNKYGRRFAGVDSSPAPSKSAQAMTKVIELLGVEYFGAAGTVEASAMLTRCFKSVKSAPLVGFSGLMLACLEDQGLADAAGAGHFDIRSLLLYSSVCGIGLDTVPVPGDISTADIAKLASDTGTMAFRLNKPLTVRLFPAPGLKAGEMTTFTSDDLCNCMVFAVP